MDDLDQERLLDTWHKYQDGHADLLYLCPVTLEAWQRCRDIEVDPHDLEFVFLSAKELAERQRASAALRIAARPYLEHLSQVMAGEPHVVALADRDGWIIDLVGTPDIFGGRAAGIAIGASWAEQHIGNNGIGTALATSLPVLVFGVDHYAQAYHSAACLGVPIHYAGTIVGALDISVPMKYADPARLGLAQACVRSIESFLAASSGAFGSISEVTVQEHLANGGAGKKPATYQA